MKLAHMIMETWKVKNLEGMLAVWRPREQSQFKFKGCLLKVFLLAQGKSIFLLLRPSTDCMRPIYDRGQFIVFKVHQFV